MAVAPTLAEGVRAGKLRAISRALSLVEEGGGEAEALMAALRHPDLRASLVGVTGAFGVGKSTLVEALGTAMLRRGERVAVLAVDPSSPFTGGALLGDRIRMNTVTALGGFVRSMATRGALGGLSAATADAVDVLEAAGFPRIVIETVGVGQDEVDVATEVETVVVALMPGAGDDIQTAKAGLLEIGDVFAVNKADRPGADAVAAALEGMLDLAPPGPWRPPVVRTSARSGEGIDTLLDAVDAHQRFLDEGGRREERRRRRLVHRVEALLAGLVVERTRGLDGGTRAEILEEAGRGGLDPYTAARRLFAALFEERA